MRHTLRDTLVRLMCCLLFGLFLAACSGTTDELPVPAPPADEQAEAEATNEATEEPADAAIPAAAESPLAGLSPLAPPVVQPLPEGYARPAGPQVLVSSVTEGESAWQLWDVASETLQPVPLDGVADYRIDSLRWADGLGLFVARMTDAQNASNLYLLDIEGNLVAQITYDPYEAGDADYSAETQLFAYVCLIQDLDVCITAANDPGLQNLTALNTREAGPQWSPDGETILFVSNAAGIVNIWAMNPDGTDRRNLSAVGLGGVLREEDAASWSPDGSTILFRTTVDDNSEVYLMAADGSDRRNLSENPAEDTSPIWSPDGSMVAFRSDRDGGEDLYVFDLASGEVVNVTNTPDVRENNFTWSGDSAQIYFDARVDGSFDLFVVNRDGSDARNLTNSSADEFGPQWVE